MRVAEELVGQDAMVVLEAIVGSGSSDQQAEDEARQFISAWVDEPCNASRGHSGADMKSPIKFEETPPSKAIAAQPNPHGSRGSSERTSLLVDWSFGTTEIWPYRGAHPRQ